MKNVSIKSIKQLTILSHLNRMETIEIYIFSIDLLSINLISWSFESREACGHFYNGSFQSFTTALLVFLQL